MDLKEQNSVYAVLVSTTEEVGILETLNEITAFGFLSNDIKDRFDKFSLSSSPEANSQQKPSKSVNEE